jgi:hypothetical protein
MLGDNSIQHIIEYYYPYFQAEWWLHHVMGMLVIVKEWGVFMIQNNWNEAKHWHNT